MILWESSDGAQDADEEPSGRVRTREPSRPARWRLSERSSPKFEHAAMRWLKRYLTEGSPRLRHFAEVAADLAKRDAWGRRSRRRIEERSSRLVAWTDHHVWLGTGTPAISEALEREARVGEALVELHRDSDPGITRASWLEVRAIRVWPMADEIAADLIEREETTVMFVRAAHYEPGAIRQAWARLEERVGDLRGRKFFGVFDVSTSEYRACVQLGERDDPAALGFESAPLAGGTYLRTRLHGEPPAVYEQISPTFAAMAQTAIPDETRPSIEFYRRWDQIDLLLPVRA